MIVRGLNDAGRQLFVDWLQHRRPGDMPPGELLDGDLYTTLLGIDVEVDESLVFLNRFNFGKYLTEVFSDLDPQKVLAAKMDGLWDWLTVLYFSQVGRKTSKYWHYSVTRRGHSGSLAYRHLVRTSYEMYWRHGDSSIVMLHVDMSTGGEMAEQLASRQNVAYHKGFIGAAHALYWVDGKLRRGAAGRVKPQNKRKPGDKAGRGGAGRLALAVRRLCRTYDTHVVPGEQMLTLLPKEFSSFVVKGASAR